MKKRYKSHKLLAYEALFRRLLPRYRDNEIIQQDYLNLAAGYQGERNMDYKLSLFPRKDFIHLPDIRLKQQHFPFQMDSVILTPKLIFILEAKHMKGTIEYHGNERQLIQVDGNKKKSYKDPILQARTQAMHLQSWLQQAGWYIPIFPIVVSTNQYAIIKNVDNHGDFTNHFITLENLPYKLEECFSKYQDSILKPTDMHQLVHSMISHHLPAKTSLIQQLNLKDYHFIKGLACPNCDSSPLKKVPREWHCPQCGYKGSVDVKRAILDYFLLHNNEYITNKNCREILNVESIHRAYRLLQSIGLKSVGSYKGRRYLPPALSDYPQDAIPRKFEFSILH